MKFKTPKEVADLLIHPDDARRVNPPNVEITGTPKEFTIEVTKMYEAPVLSFHVLSRLAEYFGTTQIQIDPATSHGGCDTCDWGSSYGHQIVVKGATRNAGFEIETI